MGINPTLGWAQIPEDVVRKEILSYFGNRMTLDISEIDHHWELTYTMGNSMIYIEFYGEGSEPEYCSIYKIACLRYEGNGSFAQLGLYHPWREDTMYDSDDEGDYGSIIVRYIEKFVHILWEKILTKEETLNVIDSSMFHYLREMVKGEITDDTRFVLRAMFGEN